MNLNNQPDKRKPDTPAQNPDGDAAFPDEAAQLADIQDKLEAALSQADSDVQRIDREYRDAKRYMADYRGEIDPHEMFQSELLLKQTDRSGAFAVSVRDKIAKLKESPYFARIDFCREGGKEPSKFYIGRFAFSFENRPLIFDWRAPVAGMFYDCGLGPAGYDAPSGRIEGELTRKRQFKIRNGIMEYALESSDNVQDDVLQRELSHTSDEKMKSIITTIQKEQNRIIRNEKAETLIIQGVAGSGKTSIALHRIAFLLYRFKNQLGAKNVTILSPNKVFGDYISNVIPELGEEPIYQTSVSDLAQIELERVIDFEPDKDPLEAQDEDWRERVRFKSTSEFVALMDRYIEQLPARVFVPGDYTCGGFTAERQWIRKRFDAYGKTPVKQRRSKVAEDIFRRFQTGNIMQEEVPRPGTILKSLTSMLTVKNTLSLYKDFYKQAGASGLFVMPAKKTLEWADVFPFIYLHAAFEGIKTSKAIKHLVIDEMQDYTPIQFAVLNLLFPCQKTILGDFGQRLNPGHPHTLEDIRRLYDGAEFVQLNKSYRSTYEIMNFAKRIQNIDSLEAVKRHGTPPALIRCNDGPDELLQIIKEINGFRAGTGVSLGIILKTNSAAKSLYDILSKECEVNLVSPESTAFENGVSVVSVRMAKGLEFDEVIIPQANKNTYSTDYDRSLLYIACTRAMHKLTLLYAGEQTGLIGSVPK